MSTLTQAAADYAAATRILDTAILQAAALVADAQHRHDTAQQALDTAGKAVEEAYATAVAAGDTLRAACAALLIVTQNGPATTQG